MKFCAFDVETTSNSAKFLSGALWSDRQQLYSTDAGALVEQLREHAGRGYVLAAHKAEYDVTNLLWRAGEDVSLHYHQGVYTCGYWRFGAGKKNAQVWDSLRLAGGLSLAKLGESIGLPKYPRPQLLTGRDPDRFAWRCELHDAGECVECYNLRDAEIVHRYMNLFQEWLNSHGVEMRRTLPSTAVALWQRWDAGQQQTVRSKEVRELARQGYHGARCEVFRYGTWHQVRTYDVRSLYGAALRSAPMPDCASLQLQLDADPAGEWLQGEGVAECTVHHPPAHIPALPVKHGDDLYYPVGVFRGSWPILELRAAIERGVEVLRCHRVVFTRQTVRPFQTFAGVLLAIREEFRAAGDPREVIPKNVLNGLTGRLGMGDDQVRRIYRRWRAGVDHSELAGWMLEAVGDQVFLCQEHLIPRPSETANILWAAQITGWGRVQLLQHLEEAGNSLIYCDTDSVHTTGYLPVGADQPGQLRDTGEYLQGLYLAPKLYRLETYAGAEVVKAKGIPAAAASRYLAEGTATFQTALGVIEGMARGLTPGQWIEVRKTARMVAARRQLQNPLAIRERDQSSETAPVVFTLSADGEWYPATDLAPQL